VNKATPVSLGYSISVFNKNSTLKQIPFPFPFRLCPPWVRQVISLRFEVTIFFPTKHQTRFFLSRVRGMMDDVVDKTVARRMYKNFMKFMNLNYPWILKQRFQTFGTVTVISVADNEQGDVERDYE